MTDEKQIEKMAEDICNACKTRHKCDKELCAMSEIVAEELAKKYQPKLPENAVVLTKEEYERLKVQLQIKTNEAEWRADQLQALDKDFELMEKVCKCKDCKWLEEKHYEDDNEKPYIKLVCKLTKRQCRLYDFCSYGEKKL